MVNIEIDGEKLEVPQGQMIIEAADAVGIKIPRFCYHEKLSIAANCRMCLVDVANAPKAVPACATPVAEGMKIFTTSVRTRDAQKAVMEFLLINHPLDCPICDQGGQCELQDVALEYGKDTSQFDERKRVVKDKNIGPLIQTEMTRCIHCTRCVRFGKEIAGVREMGATGRGEFMQIGTFVEKSVDSEISGNIIDLCPVGALTSKPFRYKARAWELKAMPSIAMHDCVGSHIYYHVMNNKVFRTLPRQNDRLNEVWLSDRDRFGYLGYDHAERLTQPQIKKDNVWQTVDWTTALQFAIEKLNVALEKGPENLGVLASPSSTVEECFLLQKLMRKKGCHNLDYRLRMVDSQHQDRCPELGISLPELEKQELIIIIGSHLPKEQPLINARVRKAALQGAKVWVINPYAVEFNFPVEQQLVSADKLFDTVLALGQQLAQKGEALPGALAQQTVESSEVIALLASALGQTEKTSILLGHLAYTHPQSGVLYWLTQWIAQQTKARLGTLSYGANSRGAWLAGMLPFRKPNAEAAEGLSAVEMFEKSLAAYFLLQCEPECDTSIAGVALKALKQAQCVVALTAYDSEHLRTYAHVLLPVTPSSESEGTFINAFDNWQSFSPAVKPLGESKPAWKVLRVLANLWDVPGFNYQTCNEVLLEMKSVQNFDTNAPALPPVKALKHNGLIRIADLSLYHVDPVVRRADALQMTADAQWNTVRIHEKTAQKLGLQAQDQVWVEDDVGRSTEPMTVQIDVGIPQDAVFVAMGIAQTIHLGAPYSAIRLEPVKSEKL